jgi:hypothetical protein
MEFAAEVEKAPQGLISDRSPRKGKTLRVLETRRGSRRMEFAAEVEKAPQGLVSDRSPRKAKTLRVLETLRV